MLFIVILSQTYPRVTISTCLAIKEHEKIREILKYKLNQKSSPFSLSSFLCVSSSFSLSSSSLTWHASAPIVKQNTRTECDSRYFYY